MRKIPTIFVRDVETHSVMDKITHGCEWVFRGEGTATRKFDGVCTNFDENQWWARRETKAGKVPPDGFKVAEYDPLTKKTFGWEPMEQSPFHKFFDEAVGDQEWESGTYELIGPKVNGNPEGVEAHQLIRHGQDVILRSDVPLNYESIRTQLSLLRKDNVEGIVWHHPDGRMAKIKVRDFRWDD